MILTRAVRRRLLVLTVASLAATVLLAVVFLRVPEAAGIGRYTVEAEFDHGAQLYTGAEVTYQGVAVGKVSSMDIADGTGIVVTMRLREEVPVPRDVRAEIHSRSAVGEQYVDLVPVGSAAADGALGEGDGIPVERTSTPVQIGPLLDNVGELVDSLPADDLNGLLDETGTAFVGRRDDLASLIARTARVVRVAEGQLEPTRGLIDDLAPFAAAFTDRGPELERAMDNLAAVTDTLRSGDADLRTLLAEGPGFSAQTAGLLRRLDAPLQTMLRNFAVPAEQLATYNGAVESLLSEYPRLTAMLQSIMLPFEESHQIALDLANINEPGVCLDGFVPPQDWRPAEDTSLTETPQAYCDIPVDDPRAVKGVRNVPCVRHPGLTGPTPESCARQARGGSR